MKAYAEAISFYSTFTLVIIFAGIFQLGELIHCLTPAGHRQNKNRRPITLTQYMEFIDEQNPTIPFSKTSSSPEQNECTVCLCEIEEGEKVRKLKCEHAFHKDCVDPWLLHDWPTCPLCRIRVLPEEIAAKFHRFNYPEGMMQLLANMREWF